VTKVLKIALILVLALSMAVIMPLTSALAGNAGISTYYPPVQNKSGEQKVLVLLVEFEDERHTLLISSIRNELATMARYYYDSSSYNIFLSVSISAQWHMMAKGIHNYTYNQSMDIYTAYLPIVTEAIASADPEEDFSAFDQIIIMHSGSNVEFAGMSFTLGGLNISTGDHFNISTVSVVAELDTWPLLAHEYAHLLGLPDLYDYSKFQKGENFSIYAGPWDLMSNDFRYGAPALTAWNLIRLGWLPDSNVVTVFPNSTSRIDIFQLDSRYSGHISTVKMPLADGTYYLAECRMPVGSDINIPDYGMLIMHIDESIPPGSGPLRIVDSNPGTASLDDAPFEIRAGKMPVFLDEGNDLAVVVQKLDVYTSGFGFSVEVTNYTRGQEALGAALFILDVREQVKSVPYIVDLFEVRDATQKAFDLYEGGDYAGARLQGETALYAHWVDLSFRIIIIIAAAAVVILLVFFRKKLEKLYHNINRRIDPLAYPNNRPEE
jgi:M6 family metalloprotease-like protein